MKRLNLNCFKFSVWVFIWETFEILYRITGLRWQVPIEYFFPNLGPWLFGKMIGQPGKLRERLNKGGE